MKPKFKLVPITNLTWQLYVKTWWGWRWVNTGTHADLINDIQHLKKGPVFYSETGQRMGGYRG